MQEEQQIKYIPADPLNPPVPTAEHSAENLPSQFTPAGFWIRLAAFYLDGIVIAIILVIPLALLAISWKDFFELLRLSQFDKKQELFIELAILPFALFLSAVLVNKFGATPGKMLLGLKIVNQEGSKPSFKSSVLREVVGRVLSVITLGVGYLIALFDKEKRTLHDRLAGTRVILSRPVGLVKKIIVIILDLLAFPILLAPLGIIAAVILISINPAKDFKAPGKTTSVEKSPGVKRYEDAAAGWYLEYNIEDFERVEELGGGTTFYRRGFDRCMSNFTVEVKDNTSGLSLEQYSQNRFFGQTLIQESVQIGSISALKTTWNYEIIINGETKIQKGIFYFVPSETKIYSLDYSDMNSVQGTKSYSPEQCLGDETKIVETMMKFRLL